MRDVIIVSAITSVIVSAIIGKITAVHTFYVIDGYVEKMIEMTKQLIRNTRLDE